MAALPPSMQLVPLVQVSELTFLLGDYLNLTRLFLAYMLFYTYLEVWISCPVDEREVDGRE